MSYTAEARVRTASAAKYVAQVCKHWAHDLKVEHQGEVGRITFPRDARGADWPGEALVSLTAEPDALLCRIEASAEGQLEGLKGAIARHIDRFAFREAPLTYDWQPAAGE
ncbi:MAG: DUF2218 domain-containing protein [Novosphingobium sp.]